MLRQICLDTETTGSPLGGGHRVIEIGCVELVDRVRTGKVYQQYLNPERKVDYGAFGVHGISDEMLVDKPKFSEVYQGFLDFIKDAELIIHNASFDVSFINNELKICNLPPITNGVIDTLILARRKYPGQPASLDALCKRFGVDNSHREKHGALLDSELLADVYLTLTADDVGMANKETDFIVNNQAKRHQYSVATPVIITANEEEDVRHKEFIKNKCS